MLWISLPFLRQVLLLFFFFLSSYRSCTFLLSRHLVFLKKKKRSIALSLYPDLTVKDSFHLLSPLPPNWYPFPPPSFLPSIPPSISGLFANQTPSVLPSPTCQEQLPAALLTTLLTTLPHLPRPAAATAGRTPLDEGRREKQKPQTIMCDQRRSGASMCSRSEEK